MRKMCQTGCKWIWVAVLIIGLDRLTKIWVVNHLALSDSLHILPIFNLTLAYNTGAAFSMLHSAAGWQNIFLSSLAVLVSVAIIYKLCTMSAQDRLVSLSLALILGGALGNVWDRLQYGYVIDFLHFHLGEWHFAIFNVADSAICIGAILLTGFWTLYKKD